MMSASENRRSSAPVGRRADDAADRDRGRQQPEADLAHAEPLAGVQDEHRPGRAERHVEGEDREGERPHRRVARRASGCPRPSRRGGCARSRTLGRASLVTTRETSTAPSAKQAAFVANGSAMPDREQERPDRRADELVRQQERALQPGVGEPEVLAVDEAREQACCSPSRRTSPRCRGRTASTRTTAMLTVPVTIVATRTTRTTARHEVRRRRPSAADRSGRRPRRRARRTGASGRYSLSSASETRNGSRVCEATSSGPAAIAMPSPMLLTNDAESSQRKLRPSRAGARVSDDPGGQGAHRRQDSSTRIAAGRPGGCRPPATVDRRSTTFPAGRPSSTSAQRVDDLVERVAPVDDRPDPARRNQVARASRRRRARTASTRASGPSACSSRRSRRATHDQRVARSRARPRRGSRRRRRIGARPDAQRSSGASRRRRSSRSARRSRV